MNKRISYLFLLVCLNSFHLNSIEQEGDGQPLKFISSCEIDLNNDGEADIALLVETIRGRELIVLMRFTSGYNAYIVSKEISGMYLSCHYGKSVKETSAGKGKKERKVYKTPGAYLALTRPEASSVAYFWNGKGFTEVWTSD